MYNIFLGIKNNVLSAQITGDYSLFKNLVGEKKWYFSPFVIKIGRHKIAIVISYRIKSLPRILFLEKIWVNPKIFPDKEEKYIANNRSKYFTNVIDVLNLYIQSMEKTIETESITKLAYVMDQNNSSDFILTPILDWYGMSFNLNLSLLFFSPILSWRTTEKLRYRVYSKPIIKKA